MSVRVIIPPQPILTSQDVIGHSDADVDLMIAAAVGEIDGPDGWLGRAIGPQTLEMSLRCWPQCEISLPFPPIVRVASVEYTDGEGAIRAVDASLYQASGEVFVFKNGFTFPHVAQAWNAVRLRYEAGYDGEAVATGGTGPVPPRILQAIRLSVQYMRALAKDDLFVRAEEVEGVGRTEYTVSEQAGVIIRDAASRLLGGLRRYA